MTGRTGRIRAFVGVPLPREVTDGYADLQRRLRSLGDVKWVEVKNLHMTLKFLGAIETAMVSNVCEALAEAAALGAPATLRPVAVTAFPSPRAARVLVVELADGSLVLPRLQADIERRMVALGLAPEERPFRTHVTLGRVRIGKVDVRRALAGLSVPLGELSVSSFALFESRTGPEGPKYAVLRSFELAS